MLDIKFVRNNKELVKKNNASRNVEVDLDKLLELDDERLNLQKKIDDMRATRKARSKTKPAEEDMGLMRKIGDELSDLEKLLKNKKNEVDKLLYQFPNINHDTTALGKDEKQNHVARKVGAAPVFNFDPQEHFSIANLKDLIDIERGAKIACSRFYYLKGKAALLERALMQFAIDTIIDKGFEFILPPILVKEEAMFGTGFFPAEKNEIYSVNQGEDNLYLIGTSEVPLVYLHANEILNESQLPLKYAAFSPCFRREAGSYGKDTKGIFRVHQFYKVEMVVITKSDESWDWHEKILAIEEEVLQKLGIHYQVVNICSGDLGFPAAKKYDCEGWFPGQGRYRELTSTSNTTDYQARRSNIKYQTAEGKKELAHTLNGTLVADRALLAILENCQQEDGTVIVPEVLRKYAGFEKI